MTDAFSGHRIQCPTCWQYMWVVFDGSCGSHQLIEDCQVCCRPMICHVSIDADGLMRVETSSEDD